MSSGHASGFAFVAIGSFFCLVPACSGGNQGTIAEAPDGSAVTTVVEADGSTGSGTGVTIITGSSSGSGSSGPTTFDAGTTGSSSGTGSSTIDSGSTGGGVCPSSCTSDSQCQSACPAAPGALNCCDTVTNACFTSASSVCPDQQTTTTPDSGGTGY